MSCIIDGILNLNNVVFIEEISEMSLWNFNCIMISVLTLYICKCSSYLKDRSNLSKFYCEKTGKWGEVRYNSYLWSLERKGYPPVYLFGTVHAPYDLVWRYIPMNTKDALMDASHVFTEVNLRDPKVIDDIRKCRQLPGNVTLKDVLPKKLHAELLSTLRRFEVRKREWMQKLTQTLFKNYLMQTPDLYNQYSRIKPVWLISTILQQWNKFAVKLLLKPRPSLDSYLVQLAHEFGSYSGGIEDVAMHCDPMENLSTDRVNLALHVTLRSQNHRMSGRWKHKGNDIRSVANLYKCGNPLNASKLGTLFSDFVDDNMREKLEKIDEYFSRELVYKRNKKMAETINNMLHSKQYGDKKMFFAVGAAHLLGNDSVVTFLQKKGYTLRHIKPNEDIPATIEKRKLEEEGRQVFINSMNSSIWRRVTRPDLNNNNKPIIIIQQIKKKYVYYYNSGKHLTSSYLSNAMALLSLLVWSYR